MKEIKCQHCGNEFNSSIYTCCPQCFRKLTAKERFFDWLWGVIFLILSLVCIGLIGVGLDHQFGDNASLFGILFLVFYVLSISKKIDKKNEEIMTVLKKELLKVESENNPWLVHEVTKAVENVMKSK